MSPQPGQNNLALLSKLPVLITESADELDELHKVLKQEVKPRGIIEQMYVSEIAFLVCDIQRLRRCKVVIINAAFRTALEHLLKQLMRPASIYRDDEAANHAMRLALDWFSNDEAKKQVSELLRQFGIDEFAIEGEAMRISASDLELLDRMLASLESRRNKALRLVAEYRGGLARLLQQSSDRIIDATDVQQLEHIPDEEPAEANCDQ
jgi:hypothetical protein